MQISNHYFLVAIGLKTKGLSANELQEAAEDLRALADNAVAAAFGGLPPSVLASIAPNGVMLAFPDATPTRAIRLVAALKWRLEYMLKGWEYDHIPRVSIVITNGPMRSVDVLGYRSNFEGRPAIAAARVLAGLEPFEVAVEKSAWPFESLVRGAAGPVRMAGKHKNEFFEVMVHRWTSLEGPPAAAPHSPETPSGSPGQAEFPVPEGKPPWPGENRTERGADARSSDAEERQKARFDVFISYAKEDTDAVARPLANELIQRGMSVWFDEYQLALGDSPEPRIREALQASQLAVVVLSEASLKNEWVRRELAGMLDREKTSGRQIVLPVFHNVTREAVSRTEPELRTRAAVSSQSGAPRMADQIASALQADRLGHPWQSVLWTGSEPSVRQDRVADVAIVAVSPIELRMVLLALGQGAETAPIVVGDQPYWIADLPHADSARRKKAVVAFAGESRWAAVASTVGQLLRDFRVPACAICGLAGAVHPDVTLGDVAVGVQVAGFDHPRLRSATGEDRGPILRVPPRIQADLEMFDPHSFLPRFQALSARLPTDQLPEGTEPSTLIPRRHIGLLASGSHVIRERIDLSPSAHQALAVDLESYGFANACASAEPRVDWLVFRGIGDVVGAKSQTNWAHVSALAAACMLVEFLASGYRGRPESSSSR